MSPESPPLRINLGFITHQPVGFRRDYLVELPHLDLPPDLSLEDFQMDLTVNRSAQGLLTTARIRAVAIIECVRCLDEFKQTLSTTFTELYAFTNRSLSESGLMYPDSGIIDFSPLVREYLILEIPISPICKADCLGLCPICGENRNLQACEHSEEDDPAEIRLIAPAASTQKSESEGKADPPTG